MNTEKEGGEDGPRREPSTLRSQATAEEGRPSRWARIESGIREGERPRETLTSLGAPRNRNDGDRPRKLSGYPSLFVIRVIRVIRGSCFCSLRGKIFNHG